MKYIKSFYKFFNRFFNKKYSIYYITLTIFVIFISFYLYFNRFPETFQISNISCSNKENNIKYKLTNDQPCVDRFPIAINESTIKFEERTDNCPLNTASVLTDKNINFDKNTSTLNYSYDTDDPTCFSYKTYKCKKNGISLKIMADKTVSVYNNEMLIDDKELGTQSAYEYFKSHCCPEGLTAGCDGLCGSNKNFDENSPKRCCHPYNKNSKFKNPDDMMGCDNICGSIKVFDSSSGSKKKCCLPYSNTGDPETTMGCDNICGSKKKYDKNGSTCCLPYTDGGDKTKMMGCDGICYSLAYKDKGGCCTERDRDCNGDCRGNFPDGRGASLDESPDDPRCCTDDQKDCRGVCRNRPDYVDMNLKASLDSNGKCCLDAWKKFTGVPNGICTDRPVGPPPIEDCPTSKLFTKYNCCNTTLGGAKSCCPSGQSYSDTVKSDGSAPDCVYPSTSRFVTS